MSGVPTEAEIIAQWKAAVDILENMRAHVDGTHAGAGGLWDTLEQALEGDYTPSELANFVNSFRSGCSDLISPSRAQEAIVPILFEWMNRIDTDATGVQGFGSGKRSVADMFRALYDWFHAKSYVIKSRTITYDSSVTTGNGSGAIVGNGAISRLTVDENGYNLEACHVEKKLFKCVADQNSGVNENAEVFECIGEASSFDSVLRANFGSGTQSNTTIVSKNAGNGRGGSLLTNSSFSTYDSTASPKFSGWTETAAPTGSIAQDTSNFYRTHPGATTDASLQITGGLGDVTLKQTLSSMRVRRLDPDTPYQFRVMVNADIGTTGAGGNFVIRMGSHNESYSVTGELAGNGWVEATLTLDANSWMRTFNEDPFDVEIAWESSTSGTLHVDDAIFAPLDLIDGTYWWLRGNAATHTPWLIDDTLAFTDTGGAPTTAILQWWLWVSGLGYLPSNATPTVSPNLSDP